MDRKEIWFLNRSPELKSREKKEAARRAAETARKAAEAAQKAEAARKAEAVQKAEAGRRVAEPAGKPGGAGFANLSYAESESTKSAGNTKRTESKKQAESEKRKKDFEWIAGLAIAAAIICACIFVIPRFMKEKNTGMRTPTMEATTLIDNDYVTVRISDGEISDSGDLHFQAEITSQSDQDITLCIGNSYANDVFRQVVFSSGGFYLSLSAGQQVETTLEIENHEQSIGELTQVELNLYGNAGSDNFWSLSEDKLFDETVVFYPYGEEEVSSFTYTLEEDDLFGEDNSDLAIDVVDINPYSDSILEVTFWLENKSETESCYFHSGNPNGFGSELYANDLHVSDHYTGLDIVLAPGKKAFETVPLYDLPEDLGDLTSLKLRLIVNVWNEDGSRGDEIYDSMLEFYPNGKNSTAVYARTEQETDLMVAETSDFRLTAISSGIKPGSADPGLYQTRFYVENLTGENLFFSIDEAYLDGQALTGEDKLKLVANTSGFMETGAWLSDLEDLDPDQVEAEEFHLCVYADEAMTELLYEDTLTFAVSGLPEEEA